jgi:hypothetical protein
VAVALDYLLAIHETEVTAEYWVDVLEKDAEKSVPAMVETFAGRLAIWRTRDCRHN